MAFCSFGEGAAVYDVTPIENMFLLEYLPSAPEDYLRVYLYARMLALHPELGGDLDGFAAALRLDAEVVYNAFTYWEQRGLVRRLGDNPPAYAVLPMRGEGAMLSSQMEQDYYKYRDFNAALQELFGSASLLHPQEYQTANDWLNVFHFEQAAVLRIVEDELALARRKSRDGKKTPEPARFFKRLDKRFIDLAGQGITTLAEYERTAAYDEEVRRAAGIVLQQLSLRRAATYDELDCARRWVKDWKLAEGDLLEGCAQTVKARNPSFAYLDKVLLSVHERQNGAWEAVKAVLGELRGGGQPTPDELRRYEALLMRGFEPETVRIAAIQCRNRGKDRFEHVEAMLEQWAKRGVYTAADARAFVENMEALYGQLKALFEAMGLRRDPGGADLAQYESWKSRHPDDVIAFGALCVKGSGRDAPARLGALLDRWAEKGVDTLAAAEAEYAANKPVGKPAAEAAPAQRNYIQRGYTDEDYDEGFFIDPARENRRGDDEK